MTKKDSCTSGFVEECAEEKGKEGKEHIKKDKDGGRKNPCKASKT